MRGGGGVFALPWRCKDRLYSHHGVVHLLTLSFCKGLPQSAQVERVWVFHPGYLHEEGIISNPQGIKSYPIMKHKTVSSVSVLKILKIVR